MRVSERHGHQEMLLKRRLGLGHSDLGGAFLRSDTTHS